VRAGAGRTNDLLIVVIGSVLVVVQPVLDGEPGGGTGEQEALIASMSGLWDAGISSSAIPVVIFDELVWD
jgi:hypothetical protein